MNKEFWTEVYTRQLVTSQPSSFARFCLPLIKEELVDLGCGNGRDLYYFKSQGLRCYGVDVSHEDVFIIKSDVATFIKENRSPETVYTRFFWHAIEPELQEAILSWTKRRLFIEARTTQDKPTNVVGRHKRNLVRVERLKKQLSAHGFEILSCEQGYGWSLFEGEDPHLVRVIAEKTK